jgi:hypothetical protein
LSYRAQLKTGNSNILKMWLPLLNYQPLSVLRDLNNLDGIKEELKTSVKCRSRTPIKVYWLKTKAHGMFHLLNSTMFLAIFTMAVLSVPMLYIKMSLPYSKSIWLANLLSSLPSSFISYWGLLKVFMEEASRTF